MVEEIILSGSPTEIGRQHGTVLRELIHSTFGMYLGLWKIPVEHISQNVGGFRRAIQDYFPHLGEEIKGIAEGSGLPEDFIYAINARTELFRDVSLLECTAAGLSSDITTSNHVLLGQNWDWINYCRALTRVVEIRPENQPRMKMLIEPGMVGKIGFNEAGVGVCLNFLKTNMVKEGAIPVHVILRGVLESMSYEEASKLIAGLPRAASANYLVGDQNNHVGSFETSPEGVYAFTSNKFVVHTNSFNARGERCPRQQKLEDILRAKLQSSKITIEELGSFLQLSSIEAPSVPAGGVETVHSIIMDLSENVMYISGGASSPQFNAYPL